MMRTKRRYPTKLHQEHDPTRMRLMPNWETMRPLRRKLYELFGEKCQECGIEGLLELAHKYYEKDSALPKESSTKREREALAHPERFRWLCNSCARAYDWEQARKNSDATLGMNSSSRASYPQTTE